MHAVGGEGKTAEEANDIAIGACAWDVNIGRQTTNFIESKGVVAGLDRTSSFVEERSQQNFKTARQSKRGKACVLLCPHNKCSQCPYEGTGTRPAFKSL